MIILRKVFNNIEIVYDELNKVFGHSDPIIVSMANYLTKDRNICQEIKDIILCNEPNTDPTINSTDSVFEAATKAINNIYKDYTSNINKSTSVSDIAIQHVNDKYNFKSYVDFVKWAICEIEMNPPSPFNLGYPVSCYSLSLNPESFIIRFPNNIGIGIEISVRDSSIVYITDIIYYNSSFTDETLFRETEFYKSAIKNNWERK